MHCLVNSSRPICCRVRPTSLLAFLRTLTAASSQEKLPEEWTNFYKFPYIKAAYSLTKLKNYQYGATLISAPVSYGLEHSGLLDAGITELCLIFGVTGSITLSFAALLSRNLVGMLYINPAKDKLRIGYLTFSGRREDRVVSVSDVKPFSETMKHRHQPFCTIETYKDKRKYKIFDTTGVLFRDDFELVFGRT